jgi:hypothetical protein
MNMITGKRMAAQDGVGRYVESIVYSLYRERMFFHILRKVKTMREAQTSFMDLTVHWL